MSTRKFRGRSIWVIMLFLILVAAGYYFGKPLIYNTTSAPPSTVAQPVGNLPDMPEKPQPQQITFDGCPPEGSNGDPELNLLKNRVDEGNYVPVSFDTLTRLTWPKSVERRAMADWSPESRAFIEQYQGIPVMVEGYIVAARESAPESANCERTGLGNVNWRLWFTKGARDDRSTAVIVEMTPRVRINRDWTLDSVRSVILNNHLPVRISGWLFFDPESPDEIGQTRATMWEILPVMQIEVFQNNRWIRLDKLAK